MSFRVAGNRTRLTVSKLINDTPAKKVFLYLKKRDASFSYSDIELAQITTAQVRHIFTGHKQPLC